MRRALPTIALALALAGHAAAHSPSPEGMVAALNTPEARTALGIARALRDARNPRVLIVRVDAHWFALDRTERVAQARLWRDDWRHAVAQGVVAVLDARSDAPVVDYAPGGAVVLRDAGGD